jgi:hypothetical protein
MVEPGHSPHEKGALIAKGEGSAVDPPVMNQAGITDGSPGDQDWHSGDHVVHDLPSCQRPDGIGPALPIDRDADHQFFGVDVRIAGR